jgi:hypothetical protein
MIVKLYLTELFWRQFVHKTLNIISHNSDSAEAEAEGLA